MKDSRTRRARSYALGFFAFSIICALISLLLIIPTLGRRGGGSLGALADVPYTIVIDAGHGGEDGGTVGNGLVEKDLNLDIALRLASLLRERGINVVLTRQTDTMLYDRDSDYRGKKKALDLRARLDITNACADPIFVSIHMNYFAQVKYSGLQVYYSPNDPESRLLAEAIQSRVAATLQPSNHRTVKEATSAIFLLHNLTCPAVLIECGFLSNAEEARLLATEEYRAALANEIFLAIEEYILADGA